MATKKILTLLSATALVFILSACTPEQAEQDHVEDIADKHFEQQLDEAVNSNQNINTATQNQSPIISNISIKQLHNINELPHWYRLTAEASDPDNPGSDNLDYEWSIDCGYFYDSNKDVEYEQKLPMAVSPENPGPIVEWRYNTDQECVEASITLKVSDSHGDSDVYSKKLFY